MPCLKGSVALLLTEEMHKEWFLCALKKDKDLDAENQGRNLK
jgi:hypothetical protein